MWKIIALITSLINSFGGPVNPNRPIPYHATPYGPQDLESAVRAREALHGENDDIRYNIDIDDHPSYAGINGSQYRWPQNTLIYDFAPEIEKDAKMKKVISEAMKHISDKTCVKFKRRTNENSYVRMMKEKRQCYSYVGCQPQKWQPQDMSLDDGCRFKGTVVHEILHALGCFHEHQRTDRDKFVLIHSNNVDPGMMRNFNMTKAIDELTFKIPYKYDSIMQYGNCAFSKNATECENNKSLWTMEARDGKTLLLEPYDKPGMNKEDIMLVKKLYNCP